MLVIAGVIKSCTWKAQEDLRRSRKTNEINKEKRPFSMQDISLTPFATHCVSVSSAGVGRTGVFITLSIVLERMRYEGVVDIFQTVKMLRTQRPAMVQTEVRGHADTRKHIFSASSFG